MAKKESSLWQLVLSLTTITALAAVALTVVYSLTKEPIKLIKQEKENNAKMAVLPGFDASKGELVDAKVKLENIEDSLIMTLAYMDGELFGAAVQTFTMQAFSGRFDIMVGFDAQGKVLETEVLSHKETPGLGDKIDKSKHDFSTQFRGLDPAEKALVVAKDGGEIDAITAATISSRAFCDAVMIGHRAFMKMKESLGNETSVAVDTTLADTCAVSDPITENIKEEEVDNE